MREVGLKSDRPKDIGVHKTLLEFAARIGVYVAWG
jgi:hypothetical protein